MNKRLVGVCLVLGTASWAIALAFAWWPMVLVGFAFFMVATMSAKRAPRQAPTPMRRSVWDSIVDTTLLVVFAAGIVAALACAALEKGPIAIFLCLGVGLSAYVIYAHRYRFRPKH